MKCSSRMSVQAITPWLSFLTVGATEGYCGPTFYSTSDASQWQVATNVGGTDGSSRRSLPWVRDGHRGYGEVYGDDGWIAKIRPELTGLGDWTFFVFRQTFDLTGYDPSTADLQFQWAADDSGQGFADRGSWTPKYSLNGGSLVAGTWPGGYSYGFGPTADIPAALSLV